MEVAIGSNNSTPFQREIHEWKHIDQNTGSLLRHRRLETDRWINGPMNAYAKKSDQSCNSERSNPHLFTSQYENGMNNLGKIMTATTTSYEDKSFISEGENSEKLQIQKRHQQQKSTSNHFQNEKTSSPLPSTVSSSTSSTAMSQAQFSLSSASAIALTATASAHSYNEIKISNSRITPQNSHQLIQQKEKNQLRQQPPQTIHQPTLFDSNNSNSIRVGVKKLITDVGGFKQHKKNLPQFITNGEKLTMNKLENNLDLNYQRSRSASIDDLTTKWDEENRKDLDESSEWRRVSKIRRSFQFSKLNATPKPSVLRPPDLPENCVSVQRIRQELEKGRSLNAKTSNKTIDLLAIDSILDGIRNMDSDNTDEYRSKPSKKCASFLTADSLKEIRGKLKKLSDETLYRDDFIANNNLSSVDANARLHSKKSQAISVTISDQTPLSSQMVRNQNASQNNETCQPLTNHTTNSLENRTTRLKDTSSAEWHLRRKSYGFEKMAPPDNQMFRLENSTDSGLGRSSDLGNFSPTENRATVITFSDGSKAVNKLNKNNATTVFNGSNEAASLKPFVQRRYRDPKNVHSAIDESMEIKRHSIAVDETKYVRENLRKVLDSGHLNRLNFKEDHEGISISLEESQRNQRKRVEFCKTEVHFAAESGRVNIVETDGKPPPSNNFRRRRRTSGNAYIDAIVSGLQVMHFGEETLLSAGFQDEKTLKTNISHLNNEKSSVTVSIPSVPIEIDLISSVANGHTSKTSSDDIDDQDEISLRGILKNKPAKPKPYHLGENVTQTDSLWGVKLKPISVGITSPEPKVRLFHEQDKVERTSNSSSVTENIKVVEQRKDPHGCYSTKINLSLNDMPFTWNSEPSSSPPSKDLHKFVDNDTPQSKIQGLSPIFARFGSIDTIRPDNNRTVSSSSPNTVMTKTNQDLKSTSLIMRTIRPIPEYEIQTSPPTNIVLANGSDAYQQHQVQEQHQKYFTNSDTTASVGGGHTTASKLISNMSEITKSNSANSILTHNSHSSTISSSSAFIDSIGYRKKYSSSLDGDTILNEDHVYTGNTVFKSSSFESTMSSESSLINHDLTDSKLQKKEFRTIDHNSYITGYEEELMKKPVAAPRFKQTPKILLMGPINQKSNLPKRRIFEDRNGSDIESDDSVQAADEEVKRYLSNELLDQLDEGKSSNQVVANSWNRLKAGNSSKKNDEINIKDIPQSNVMSIQLQSSEANSNSFTNIHQPSKNIEAPIAKLRTSIQSKKGDYKFEIDKTQVKVSSPLTTRGSPSKVSLDTLKIDLNGARKLRQHELSYFGVKVNHEEDTAKLVNKNNTQSRNQLTIHQLPINETNRKLIHNNPKIIEENALSSATENVSTTKWKLSCDKPDLLRHSPLSRSNHNSMSHISIKDEQPDHFEKRTHKALIKEANYGQEEGIEGDQDASDPIYENLKLPYPYNRKDDLIRDEMILSEMTKAADQTMKTVSDAHKVKKRREKRRSEQHHQTIPLDTIEEKSSSPQSNCNELEKSYLQQTENSQRRASLGRRSSSASSTSSYSDTGSMRNQSLNKTNSTTHTAKKTAPMLFKSSKGKLALNNSPVAVTVRRAVEHRSSSQESHNSHKSSTDPFEIPQKIERRHKQRQSTTRKQTSPSSEKYQIESSASLSRHPIESLSQETNERRISRRSMREQSEACSSDNNIRSTDSPHTPSQANKKVSQRSSTRSTKELPTVDKTHKVRSSSRLLSERCSSDARSTSESRVRKSSYDRKETNSRQSSFRGLRDEKNRRSNKSLKTERADRTPESENLQRSERSQRVEDSYKLIRPKEKLSNGEFIDHKSPSAVGKTSIQHDTKTATIPAIKASSSGTTKHLAKHTSKSLSSTMKHRPRSKELQNRKK